LFFVFLFVFFVVVFFVVGVGVVGVGGGGVGGVGGGGGGGVSFSGGWNYCSDAYSPGIHSHLAAILCVPYRGPDLAIVCSAPLGVMWLGS
jgi:hypothetical protein